MSTSVLTFPGTRTLAKGRRRSRQGLLATVLLAPSAIFLLAFTYWPVLQVVPQALTVRIFRGPSQWGLGNFERLAGDPHFARAVSNNLLYATGTIIPSLVLALAFAIALWSSSRFNTVLRTLMALPLLVPMVAAAALFIFIFLPGAGLLDYYLGRQTNWLGDPSLALSALIALTVWKNTGYYMLFFLAGLAGLPNDMLDAARVDGAGPWARFRHVMLPLLGPTIAFVLVIASINALTQVDHVIVMTQGGPSDATNLVLYYIYQQAHQNSDLGLATAATVLSVAALMALSAQSLRTLERGIHYES